MRYVAALVLLFALAIAHAESNLAFLLFGGGGHKTFLGCLNVTGNPIALYFSTPSFGTMRSGSTTRGWHGQTSIGERQVTAGVSMARAVRALREK